MHYQFGFDFLDYIQGLLCLDRNILPFGFLAFEVKTYNFIDESDLEPKLIFNYCLILYYVYFNFLNFGAK